ncbi:alpha/beta hydrolase [Actinoalloteichus spitiensis]|uniref:alpha/beta hydrolase n=1 Tax=Actinoalloteichus spitiensis TaxID=252394 RepID=UPI000376AE6A|nr:alpha/beta hydrolase [Actinoalloteichus spitiensis]
MAVDWRDYDRDELARQYSPSSRVHDIAPYLADYARRSEQARRDLEVHRGLSYGPGPDQAYDYFPAPRPGAPLHVFVHGGYWQELSRHDSAFPALDLVPAGAAFAALGYGLAPAHGLAEIVASVSLGIRHLCRHRSELPGRPSEVHLSGTSAGAHLVASALLDVEGWRRDGLDPARAIGSAALLSGVYELEPLRHTYVNDALGLDTAAAAASSPLLALRSPLPPLLVARGRNETEEFARQHREFVDRARAVGTEVTDVVVPGRNHFDLPLDLGRPGTVLGDAVRRRMRVG